MDTVECDVLVVGAGPAGSMAAKSASENGADVIIIEEHEAPGQPVFCAEGLSLGGIKDSGLEAVPGIVCQQIKTARVYSPDRNFIALSSDDWTGFTLNRDAFDRALAENAVKAGATLMTSTSCKGVLKNNGQVTGVHALTADGKLEIRAKVTIGGDGHWSIVRRSAGLERYFSDWVSCAQFQLGGLDLEPAINEFWLGRKYSPGGYGWVFPKSSEVANVGLGVRRIHEKPALEYLKEFVDQDPRFRNARILGKNGGICPVSGTLDKIVDDGLMLVGDAAGQLIPMTGAGIHTGIEAGKMAGRVAASAVKEGDVSAEKLSLYRTEFDKYWGKRITDSNKVLMMLDKFTDADLNNLAQVITNDDILALANGTNVAGALTGLIKRCPMKIMRLLRAYLR